MLPPNIQGAPTNCIGPYKVQGSRYTVFVLQRLHSTTKGAGLQV